MSSKRNISWSTALRELRADRATRAPVREERLRTSRYASSALVLSAWRGLSGRRYVVSVHPVGTDLADFGPAVVLAVARDAAGVATLLADRAGATEIHVHRLAETAADRAAVLADLLLDRAEIEDAVEGLVSVLDAIDGDPDLEDGADAEPSLAAPENHHGSQTGWCRGSDSDGEIAAPGRSPDILARAARLLAQPGAWTRGASARDRSGNPVPANSPLAVMWDICGVLDRVSNGNTGVADAAEYALHALGQQSHGPAPMGLAALNDMLTHADVVALLRDARHLHG